MSTDSFSVLSIHRVSVLPEDWVQAFCTSHCIACWFPATARPSCYVQFPFR